MSEIQYRDQDGTPVEVLDERKDSLGNIDSYFIRRNNQTLWVHASDIEAVGTGTYTVTNNDQPIVPERNRKLDIKRVVNKVFPWTR